MHGALRSLNRRKLFKNCNDGVLDGLEEVEIGQDLHSNGEILGEEREWHGMDILATSTN